MEGQSNLLASARDYLLRGLDIAQRWASDPAAWSQFALIAAAAVLALVASRWLRPRIERIVSPPEGTAGIVATLRRAALVPLPLLFPVLAFLLTAAGEGLVRSVFGAGEVIAFGKRVFLFLAARSLVRDIVWEPFLRLLGRYVLVPVAALYAVGILDDVTAWLSGMTVQLGNISFTAMALVRGVIAGSLLFWLGGWTNRQSSSYIKAQQEMRPATRELAAKATEVAIFGVAFLLLLNIVGIDLTTVAVLGGAVGVGIGLGLQQIASNFVSGVILLLEGQTTVGDFVELDGGEAGTIVKMTARACVLETFDGRWIVVPNEHFITTRVINYSDQGSSNRYEAAFSVSYDTDINRIPDLVEAAVAKLPFVLREPDGPDVELKGFGESGIDFAVEYWVQGIDDGRNKYGSHVLFAIWNALRDAGIEIPYPHRVVELRGNPAA
jgi:small-conductance mechanosensitive channel